MYLPKTKWTGPLYTPQGVYVTPDGESFSGWFFITYEAKSFAGLNPSEEQGEIILKVVYDAQQKIQNAIDNFTANYLDIDNLVGNSVTRYFILTKSNSSVKEVTKERFVELKDLPYLDTASIQWFVKGTVSDISQNGYIIEGVETKNARELTKNKTWLKKYLTNLSEYFSG